jgi:hypothetical protein
VQFPPQLGRACCRSADSSFAQLCRDGKPSRSSPLAQQRAASTFRYPLSAIDKRDWSLKGFASSLGLSATRNHSTLPIYEEKRVRGEIRLTRAF